MSGTDPSPAGDLPLPAPGLKTDTVFVGGAVVCAVPQEEADTDGYTNTALKESLPDVRVHLTARRTDQMEYRRMVTLAG
ncbi:hypothetical protein [Streptomyces sp. NPDC059072]|uniref:hypothetical protein n=1 Tax=Streptomyces sp. NPDC059072 TaxID=3346715 RepID=UPI0036A78314